MHTGKATLALLAVLMLAPVASAAFTLSAPSSIQLDTEGSQTLTFSATQTCDEILQSGAQTMTRTVTMAYPNGFSGDASVDITFDASECNPTEGPGASLTADNVSFSITPGPAAAGETPLNVQLAEADSGATGEVPFSVAYRTGYELIVDQEFPVTVQKDEEGNWIPVEFTGTIKVTANADTMVMMSQDQKAQFGLVSGFFDGSPFVYKDLTPEQIENGIEQEIQFSYMPTSDAWTEDTIAITTWGHSMATPDLMDEYEMEWTFVNGEVGPDGEPVESPSIGAGALIVGLVGVAAMLRRRS